MISTVISTMRAQHFNNHAITTACHDYYCRGGVGKKGHGMPVYNPIKGHGIDVYDPRKGHGLRIYRRALVGHGFAGSIFKTLIQFLRGKVLPSAIKSGAEFASGLVSGRTRPSKQAVKTRGIKLAKSILKQSIPVGQTLLRQAARQPALKDFIGGARKNPTKKRKRRIRRTVINKRRKSALGGFY